MGLVYNKKPITKKNRRVVTSSPGDIQRKQRLSEISEAVGSVSVDALKEQIDVLQKQLSEASIAGGGSGLSPEQIDAEIIRAVKSETAHLVDKYSKEIESLKDVIKAKDAMIEQLRDNYTSGISEDRLSELIDEVTAKIEGMTVVGSIGMVDSDRPQMEEVFIDPIEGETVIESHFKPEDIKTEKKKQMMDKVNKLKDLMGSLPKK